MAHARESIRKAIVTAVTGLTTTGTRVVSGRLHTQPISGLPGLAVEVARRNQETRSGIIADELGDIHYRQLPVEFIAMVQVVGECEDTLDDICAEVETALHANAPLAALIRHQEWVSTEFELSGEGERAVGTARISWLFHYGTTETAPATAI